MGTTPLAAIPYPDADSFAGKAPGAFEAALEAVEQKLILSYASAAARTAAIPAPVAGMVTYLLTPKRIEMYDGTRWVVIGGKVPQAAIETTTAQSIPHNTATALGWTGGTELYDTDGIYTASAPSRFTVPAGLAGKWAFGLTVYVPASMAGTVSISFRANGSYAHVGLQSGYASSSGQDLGVTTTFPLALTDGQYVEAMVTQVNGSSAARNVHNAAVTSRFWCEYRGGFY